MEDVILVRNIYRDKNVFTVDHRSAEKKRDSHYVPETELL